MNRLRKVCLAAGLILAYLLPAVSPLSAAGTKLPRTVLALYDSENRDDSLWSMTHQFAEMPLNHLGLKLRYHNIRYGLPDIKEMDNLAGVLTWYPSGTQLREPVKYLKWAESVIQSGKKLVIMGDPGFRADEAGKPVPWIYLSRFFRRMGIQDLDEWVDYTYDLEFLSKNRKIVEFERSYQGTNIPYSRLRPGRADVQSHLVVQKAGQPATDSHVVMTTPAGGYVADGYAVFTRKIDDREIHQWLINPFAFFRLAFNTDVLPKPDCTTLAGRRIYYSHIDGDGWLNISHIEEYREKKWLSSRVILEEVIRPYPDLPITVTAVAAELDPEWSGSEISREIAREIFKLPHVEIGSHTYSHPFDWSFFEDGDIEREIPYLHKYPDGGWGGNGLKNRFLAAISKKIKKDSSYLETWLGRDEYLIPRAYARRPFDLDLEIKGSADYLNRLAPGGKKALIMMWSGNTTPFEAAVRKTRMSGLYNINGGDSRFDREYPSYLWVSPIGRQVGDEIQIYASNSNENTYTDLWRGRFHGFRYVRDTFENTEHPRRVKPMNVYYHMYSGERRASLHAVIDNLKFALASEIIPTATSRYAAIAEGFFSTRIEKTGTGKWLIENRKKLQTIRFDDADSMTVDFSRSDGIIGQRRYQGNLYVYLDESIPTAQLALRRFSPAGIDPVYLIQSRWRVWNLDRQKNRFVFKTKGFGQPEMTWRVPRVGNYGLTITDRAGKTTETGVRVDDNRILTINPADLKNDSATVTVTYKGRQ